MQPTEFTQLWRQIRECFGKVDTKTLKVRALVPAAPVTCLRISMTDHVVPGRITTFIAWPFGIQRECILSAVSLRPSRVPGEISHLVSNG